MKRNCWSKSVAVDKDYLEKFCRNFCKQAVCSCAIRPQSTGEDVDVGHWLEVASWKCRCWRGLNRDDELPSRQEFHQNNNSTPLGEVEYFADSGTFGDCDAVYVCDTIRRETFDNSRQ